MGMNLADLVKRCRKPFSYGIPCIIEHEVGLLPVIISDRSWNAVLCRYFKRRVCTYSREDMSTSSEDVAKTSFLWHLLHERSCGGVRLPVKIYDRCRNAVRCHYFRRRVCTYSRVCKSSEEVAKIFLWHSLLERSCDRVLLLVTISDESRNAVRCPYFRWRVCTYSQVDMSTSSEEVAKTSFLWHSLHNRTWGRTTSGYNFWWKSKCSLMPLFQTKSLHMFASQYELMWWICSDI